MKKTLVGMALCLCLSLGGAALVYGAAEGEEDSTLIVQDELEGEALDDDADDESTQQGEKAEDVSQEVTDEPQEITETPEDATDIESTVEAGVSGWNQGPGGWRYFAADDAAAAQGLQTIDGKTYYFDASGILQTGLQTVDGGTTYHYFSEEGATPTAGLGSMVKAAWVETADQSVYYMDANGVPLKGWADKLGKYSYYFDTATGKMLLGFQKIDGKTFYFKKTGTLGGTRGAMLRNWQNIGGKSYYFKATGDPGVKGQMFVGFQPVGSKTYYFDESESDLGALKLGWQTIGGKNFYFKKTGDKGVKGQMFVGWGKIGGNIYYFQPTGNAGTKGQLCTGWQTIGNRVFYFYRGGTLGDKKGILFTGWKNIGSKTYYFKASGGYGTRGAMLTGWLTLNNKKYYLKTTGGYADKGSLYLGWQKIGGKTYYFKKTGAHGVKGQMFKSWQQLNDSWYYFGSNGAMATGWKKVSGHWYYMDKTGKMLTGWHYINVKNARYGSYKFYFRPKKSGSAPMGSLVQDVSNMVSGPYYAEISRTQCVVTIYAKDESGQYRIPVKAMTCSVGLPGTPTPTGTFNTMVKYRWKALMGNSWGQYATRIVGGVLFHSVAGSAPNPYALPAAEYNRLGSPASHGCVRLCVRDAKWIYDNCAIGMTVRIADGLYQPFDKPATIKIPASQNWDPTDPNI